MRSNSAKFRPQECRAYLLRLVNEFVKSSAAGPERRFALQCHLRYGETTIAPQAGGLSSETGEQSAGLLVMAAYTLQNAAEMPVSTGNAQSL